MLQPTQRAATPFGVAARFCEVVGVKVTEAERRVSSECTKAVCLARVRVSCFSKNAFTLHPLSTIR